MEQTAYEGDDFKVFPVLMRIRSKQDYKGAEPEDLDLTTEGSMFLTEECVILRYEETELTGMQGTITTFQIRGPQVILSRAGTVNSQMIFEKGRQYTSVYETPFGGMTIDIQTSRLEYDLTERGGSMEISYSISVEHALAGRNHFKLRVRPRRR